MLDTIIVSAIVIIAAAFVGRRLYRQFTAKSPACGCSGCDKANSCSGISETPNMSSGCGQ